MRAPFLESGTVAASLLAAILAAGCEARQAPQVSPDGKYIAFAFIEPPAKAEGKGDGKGDDKSDGKSEPAMEYPTGQFDARAVGLVALEETSKEKGKEKGGEKAGEIQEIPIVEAK